MTSTTSLSLSPFTLLITTPMRIISGSYIRGEEGRLMRGGTLEPIISSKQHKEGTQMGDWKQRKEDERTV